MVRVEWQPMASSREPSVSGGGNGASVEWRPLRVIGWWPPRTGVGRAAGINVMGLMVSGRSGKENG